MKTSEQRLQETIERVQALPSELKQELAECIATNRDSAHFLVRDGRIRGRGRSSPWIGLVEHVANALQLTEGAAEPVCPLSPPLATPRTATQFSWSATWAVCALCLVAAVGGLLLWHRVPASRRSEVSSHITRQSPVGEQEPEPPNAHHVPGAAPGSVTPAPSETAPAQPAAQNMGAAPQDLSRERLLNEVEAALQGGLLPRTGGETEIALSRDLASKIDRALHRVGMAFGLRAYDDATVGIESIQRVRLDGSEDRLIISIDSMDPDRTATALANLLAVAEGCSVSGTEIHTLLKPGGTVEILGPARRVRVRGLDGHIRWRRGEVTLELFARPTNS